MRTPPKSSTMASIGTLAAAIRPSASVTVQLGHPRGDFVDGDILAARSCLLELGHADAPAVTTGARKVDVAVAPWSPHNRERVAVDAHDSGPGDLREVGHAAVVRDD